MRARHVAPLLPIENEVVEDEDVGFTGDSSRISGAGFSTNLPILGVLNFIWGITVMVPFGFFRALRKVAREGGGVRLVSHARTRVKASGEEHVGERGQGGEGEFDNECCEAP
jgi:hypothetical protein